MALRLTRGKEIEMLRGVASKVMWVGRATIFMVGLAVVLFLTLAIVADAADARKRVPALKKGVVNTVSTMTTLVGSIANPILKLDNDGAGTALQLEVGADQPPLVVNADSGTATNFDADELDGKDSSDFAAAYKRTVVVSPVGTHTENGAALIDALSGITDASAAKPYLLYVEPGTYDLGSNSLQMKEHVDIQGAGERKTLITGDVVAATCQGATVVGANEAELRFLTARNTSGLLNSCNIAIYYPFGTSSHLTSVTAEATGVGGGLNMGVYADSESNLTLTNVTATASGAIEANYGVRNDPNVTMTMFNVTAAASGGAKRNYGTANDDSGNHGGMSMIDVTSTASGGTQVNYGVLSREPKLTIRQSKLSGSTHSVDHRTSDGEVALSQLVGPVSSGLRCFNNYDENMAEVSCP